MVSAFITEDDFEKLSYEEKVSFMEARLGGNHEDRIKSLVELYDLIGNEIYIVISPFGPDENDKRNLGNSYLYEWKVGSIINQNKDLLSDRNAALYPDNNDEFYCLADSDVFKAINVTDLNIIPNINNNHTAFTSKEGAEAYMVYRKLTWPIDEDIDIIANQFDFWLSEEQIDDKKE